METSVVRILWADDQPGVQSTLASLLASIDHDVIHVSDGRKALDELQKGKFDVLILDLKMPPDEWGGLWLLREIREMGLSMPTLVLSGEGSQAETISALREGASDYVTKDSAETDLLPRLKDILKREGPAAKLQKLISIGETAGFECKETLRWNIKASKFDKAMEHAVAKTIAAFMNTSGGTLAVGVNNSGKVVGLDQDRFASQDAILLHLDNLINTFLGNPSAPFISSAFIKIEGKDVLKIDCAPAPMPVYLSNPGSTDMEFFIRRQASSIKLKLNEAVAYIGQKFKLP